MAFIIREYPNTEKLINSLINGIPIEPGPIKTTIIPLDSSEFYDTHNSDLSNDKFEIAQKHYKHIHQKMQVYYNENKTSIHPEICKILDEHILKEDSDSLSIFYFGNLDEELVYWIDKNPGVRKSYTTHLLWFHDKIQQAKSAYAKIFST